MWYGKRARGDERQGDNRQHLAPQYTHHVHSFARNLKYIGRLRHFGDGGSVEKVKLYCFAIAALLR